MSAQHTPGPWEFAEWNAGINNSPGYGIMAEHGSLNVTVHTRKPKGDGLSDVDCTDQAQADARLIAAAPDLLEALEVLLNLSQCADETGYVEDVGFVDIEEVHQLARTAIAKAKGDAP